MMRCARHRFSSTGQVGEQVELLEHHAHLSAYRVDVLGIVQWDAIHYNIPAVEFSSMLMQRSRVDLPEPEGR